MFNFILVLELFYVVTTTTYDLFRHFLIFMGTYINIYLIFLSIWYGIPTEKLASIHCLLNQGN